MTGPLVMGFHPSSRGFGWTAFVNPFALHAFGVYDAGKEKNASCLKKLTWLLKRYEPEVLVMEAFGDDSGRAERVRELCRSVVSAAAERSVEVIVLTRADVQRIFSFVGARTREEIAAAVAQHLPALQARLPKKREVWAGEDRRMSLFAAAALVLAHYHNGAAALLDDLRNAA